MPRWFFDPLSPLIFDVSRGEIHDEEFLDPTKSMVAVPRFSSRKWNKYLPKMGRLSANVRYGGMAMGRWGLWVPEARVAWRRGDTCFARRQRPFHPVGIE
jgi:hypothetical protein